MTVYQSDCFCLAVVSTTAFIGDIGIEYAAAVSSSQDCCLTQSAEMIFWAVDPVLESRV